MQRDHPLHRFWVVAKEGGFARVAEGPDMAVQTLSARMPPGSDAAPYFAAPGRNLGRQRRPGAGIDVPRGRFCLAPTRQPCLAQCVHQARQPPGIPAGHARRAQLGMQARLGTAHATVRDEHQRDEARGGFWTVNSVAAHAGSPWGEDSLRWPGAFRTCSVGPCGA